MSEDIKADQISLAERLQLKLLRRFDKMLDDGTLTPTDAATLTRLLMANGWNIDPSRVPQRLRSVLTDAVDATRVDVDDPDLERPH